MLDTEVIRISPTTSKLFMSPEDFQVRFDISSIMKRRSFPYQVVTGKWRISRNGNTILRTKETVGSFQFEDLPSEIRLMIYQFLFGVPTLLDIASAKTRVQASIFGLPLQSPYRSWDNEFINLLLVSKKIYKEAAYELYKMAQVFAEPEKVIMMVSDAYRIACSQALTHLAPGDRVSPEGNIRSLTIFLRCGVLNARNHNTEEHARVADRLRAAIAQLKTGFPRLKELVIRVSHYQDLISGSAVMRFVSPLCCLRRLKSIQFAAEDVRARLQASAAGNELKGASRLRIEIAVLSVLTDSFTSNCDTVPEGKYLHEDDNCIYRGLNAGVQLQRKILSPILRMKHRVKVAALM